MAFLKFEKVYKIPITCLKTIRAHPDIPQDWHWAWQAGIMHGIFTLSFVSFLYSLIAVDIKADDFSKACTNGIFLVVWVVVTFQYGVVLTFKDQLKTLIRINQENFDAAESMPEEDQALIREYAYRARWVTKVWCFSCCLNCALFPIKSLVLTLYSLYIDDFRLVPWYDCSFPSVIEEIKYRPDIFCIIFSMHIFYGVYAILMYIGFCPLGFIFILNTCAQLELMAKEFTNMFNVTPYNHKVLAQKMSALIKKSQDVYDYVQLINDVFKVLYEISLKASAIMLPITLYQVIDSFKRHELCMEYMAFILTASLLCYVPCYYSDLLMEKGEALRLAIYSSGWEYQYDKSARYKLIIMLTVAIRPISIRSIFRTVCLDTFAGLCHEAYAIFNLINAMWN
ncbi:odorant receptor 10a-like [Choristoneura fumiferana]|uniref:odorant receptor 10a-like n=1 Tax=Choristoneura fumiferana TaxID=7141 RepID=UPI003D15B90C